MSKLRGVREDQRGVVSILVVMIMIIVITLIVLGLAQVTRRNQREALDNQLASQAYYAAESGINAATSYLSNNDISGFSSGTNCNSFISKLGTVGTVNVLNASSKVQYTCLLVNPNPGSLVANPVTQDSNIVWKLANTGSVPFGSLTFNWTQASGSTGTNSCNNTSGQLPSYSSWNCYFGILRVDLVDGTDINQADLESNKGVTSLYLVPTFATGGDATNSTTISVPPTASASCNSTTNCPARIVHVLCAASGSCQIKLNLSGGQNQYYARMNMLYRDAGRVQLTANDGSGSPLNFVGGQASIDATGQAQDVLKRIQVRVPLFSASSTAPLYGLSSTDSVCKPVDSTSTGTDCTPGGGGGNSPSCRYSGPNLIPNGDFSQPLPNRVNVSGVYFQTDLPYRGANQYPDDNGNYGTTGKWAGGFSVWTGDQDYPAGTITTQEIRGVTFPGDPVLGVPATQTYWYSNPNQHYPPIIFTSPGNFKGTIWQNTITGLTAGKTYYFVAYVYNLLYSPSNPSANSGTVDPNISVSANGTLLKNAVVPKSGQWMAVGNSITLPAGQTSALLNVTDNTGNYYGDDFGMTALSLFECK